MAENNLEHIRHTLAHLLAAAVLEQYPHAKPTIGPAIENGFYYDFDFSGGDAPGQDELKKLEKRMRKLLPQWKEFTHETVLPAEARERFLGNEYKTELIDELEKHDEAITLYTSGGFTDLCRGGHAEHPSKDIDADAFALTSVAGAYWRGDENNPMLTRIYGVAFTSKEELDKYQELQEEAKKRDHRKLGKELDLFTFSDLVGSGLPLFTPRGTLMRDLIVEKIMHIQEKYGYQKVTIPHITKSDLYKISGHWEKFGDELFKVTGKAGAEFVMKPMNCPHHTQIYASHSRSYKELPVRYAETTMVYRDEQQGELIGLSRVRAITQDDGHVFCTPEQIEQEVENIVNVIKEFYTTLNMYEEEKFWVSLSTRDPDNFLGDIEVWNNAEATLEEIAQRLSLPHTRIEGEAAFYGPKLDFMFYDALGRERQLATVQLDFIMPSRFELTYVDAKGAEQTPVMIHRAIAGSLERFMAIMIEHFAGAFPLWLAPEQVRVLAVSDAHQDYAKKVTDEMKAAGIRVEHDESNETLGKRIRNAKMAKVPYFLVLGDKEVDGEMVTLESRDSGEGVQMPLTECIERLQKEIAGRS